MTESKKQIDLWLIRHAQSLWNTGTVKDEKSIPNCGLSDQGKQQATSITGPVDLLILSPLRRALDTYVRSKLQEKRLVVSDLFREHATGASNCLELEDLSFVETQGALQKRVEDAIAFVKQQPETRVAILSHHDFLAAFTRRIRNDPLYLSNAQVVHLNLAL